ncbi:MAG: CDGSH iron-sulfur domain-containing protein [Acidiferrobacter sp.]
MATPTTPYAIDLEAGTHYFCQCGRSANLPFCDGAHQGSGIEPYVVTVETAKTAYICACNQSRTRPFCDGTHKNLDSAP